MRVPPRASGPTVMVVGSDFKAGPWAIRSLRRAGFRVVGAHGAGRLAGGRSLACPRPERHPDVSREPDAFLDWLTATVARVGADAVLATTEEATRVIATAEPGALGRARLAGPTAAQYRALCDKATLNATAAAAGVDHPRSVVVDDGTVTAALPVPAVVKARDSGEAVDRLGRAIMCDTPDELRDALSRMVAAGGRAIVQERLVGRRWNFHGVAVAGGVHGFATRVVREYPRGRGITSLARSTTPPDGFRAAVEALVAEVGYRGPISVQVIERASGSFAVHDVNLRLPASIGLTIRAGLDVPRLAVADLLGLPLGPLPAAPRPVAYLGVDGEVNALRDALRGGGGESVRQVLGTVRGVVGGRAPVVDPNPLDPFWLPTLAARRVRGRMRSVLRGA